MLFCRHKWDKVSEQILPSAFEQSAERACLKTASGTAAYFAKMFILVLSCSKCGKIKTITKISFLE